ncbi:MAG: sulfite exporter TauE/SafE family protein [Candidatus Latescibacteria bacterium]|nr:sulfite exporter TauE/SafE family protein [Candidatus Latescibacterota bacterium]
MNPNPMGLMLVGVLAGVLPGVFGFGGGWLLLPILTFVLGVPWSYASGMVLCAILAGAASGVVNRLGKECKKPMPSQSRVRLIVVGSAAFGTVIGKAWVRDWLSGSRSAPLVLDGILGFALLVVAVRYFYTAQMEMSDGKAAGPSVLLVGVGMATFIPGVLSGLTGIGGGVFYVPILLGLLHWNKDNARDVSRMAVLWSALIGAALYAGRGGVPLSYAACMFVPSALAGAMTSSIRFDRSDSDGGSARGYRTKQKPMGFEKLAGALALVALVLTALHAIGGAGGACPPVGGGSAKAALAAGVPLSWGIICGLAQRFWTRWLGKGQYQQIGAGK